MKFAHLGDLHLGKNVNGFSMIEDQKYILKEIIDQLDIEKVDAVLIAGDVYDKSIPPESAVSLFDDFLNKLHDRSLPVLIVSGNHDSAERLDFASSLLADVNIHMAGEYKGTITKVTLNDAHGPVNFYLMPFVRPSHVRRYYPDTAITDYTSAIATAIEAESIDPTVRNVFIGHQFVLGATKAGSEEITLGSLDLVEASVFEAFDYTALGHIHRPQNVIKNKIRYAGSPLKYSMNEKDQLKVLTIVELNDKGQTPVITEKSLTPLRDMVELTGTFAELTSSEFAEKVNANNYLRIVLTDEEVIPDAISLLRRQYPYIMELDYCNRRSLYVSNLQNNDQQDEPDNPLELFIKLFEQQNGKSLSEEQLTFVQDRICRVFQKEESL